MSRAAIGMRSSNAATSATPALACPAGATGSGTADAPCRAASTCSTTPPGVAPDPACVTARYLDSDGDVLYFLATVQSASQSAPATPTLSTADVTAALTKLTASKQ
jgi:hypothetical protein